METLVLVVPHAYPKIPETKSVLLLWYI